MDDNKKEMRFQFSMPDGLGTVTVAMTPEKVAELARSVAPEDYVYRSPERATSVVEGGLTGVDRDWSTYFPNVTAAQIEALATQAKAAVEKDAAQAMLVLDVISGMIKAKVPGMVLESVACESCGGGTSNDPPVEGCDKEEGCE